MRNQYCHFSKGDSWHIFKIVIFLGLAPCVFSQMTAGNQPLAFDYVVKLAMVARANSLGLKIGLPLHFPIPTELNSNSFAISITEDGGVNGRLKVDGYNFDFGGAPMRLYRVSNRKLEGQIIKHDRQFVAQQSVVGTNSAYLISRQCLRAMAPGEANFLAAAPVTVEQCSYFENGKDEPMPFFTCCGESP